LFALSGPASRHSAHIVHLVGTSFPTFGSHCSPCRDQLVLLAGGDVEMIVRGGPWWRRSHIL
jgi:hypothetical protein